MDSRLVKQLSYVALAGGVASIVGSAISYLAGRGGDTEERRHMGVFVGLWAPTFFAIAEMLDRISEEDRSYMGLHIEREAPVGGIARELVHR